MRAHIMSMAQSPGLPSPVPARHTGGAEVLVREAQCAQLPAALVQCANHGRRLPGHRQVELPAPQVCAYAMPSRLHHAALFHSTGTLPHWLARFGPVHGGHANPCQLAGRELLPMTDSVA